MTVTLEYLILIVYLLKVIFVFFAIFRLGKVLKFCLTQVSGKNQSFTNQSWFCQNLQIGTKSGKKPKWQYTQKVWKFNNCKNKKNCFQFLVQKRVFLVILKVTPVELLIVLIETLLYCIFCMYVNCVLIEYLAECKRFKSFLSVKWLKVQIKCSPSSFLGSPFCTCDYTWT